MFSSEPQSIEVRSDPPGARFRYGTFSGITPATVAVPRKALVTEAIFSMEGYNEKVVPVTKSVQGITYLGLGWMFIDFLTGNAYKVDPPIINATLDPAVRAAENVNLSSPKVERSVNIEATDVGKVLSNDDVKQLQAGVVKIAAKSLGGATKVGTGFIVRLDKDLAYIVTAAHVVTGDPQPAVEFFTKRNMHATAEVLGLEGDDEVRGLALLVVRNWEKVSNGLRTLPLAETLSFSGGEGILMIGFPGNAGPWNVVRGNISSRQGRDLYFSPAVDSGHSGGPILQNGKVVGLVSAVGQSSGRGIIARSVQDYVEGFGVSIR
jgi:S1-C subfamily serine protease